MATLLTVAYLRELQKKERDSRKLEKLHPDFYASVTEYVARKNNSGAQGGVEKSELESAMPVIKYILLRREQKILEAAILSVRSGIKPENLLAAEEAFFHAACGIIAGRKAEVDGILGMRLEKGAAGGGMEKSASPAQDAAAPPEKEAVQMDEKKADVSSSRVRINILREVPAFIAEDLLAHGPWSAGETAECPPKAAAILVENGFAEYG